MDDYNFPSDSHRPHPVTAIESSWPSGRAHPERIPCPWCGVSATLLSYGDERERLRIEFYCDNQDCTVREWEARAL